jgi:hypothetical protein
MPKPSAAATDVADYESALQANGTDPITLTAWAKLLVGLSDVEFAPALSGWESEADDQRYRAPMGIDCDFGSVILEALGDEASGDAQKRRLYEAACRRAQGYASGASSGGEGMARMIRVRRIEQKLRRLPLVASDPDAQPRPPHISYGVEEPE